MDVKLPEAVMLLLLLLVHLINRQDVVFDE